MCPTDPNYVFILYITCALQTLTMYLYCILHVPYRPYLCIYIVYYRCPTDADLFPQFTKLSRGVMASSFKAFIPSDYTSNRVTVTFTCTLDVCLNTCPQVC